MQARESCALQLFALAKATLTAGPSGWSVRGNASRAATRCSKNLQALGAGSRGTGKASTGPGASSMPRAAFTLCSRPTEDRASLHLPDRRLAGQAKRPASPGHETRERWNRKPRTVKQSPSPPGPMVWRRHRVHATTAWPRPASYRRKSPGDSHPGQRSRHCGSSRGPSAGRYAHHGL